MASGTQSLEHGVQQSSRQLEFRKAMSDFKLMFPSIDYDVIEMVLRANNGLVDATVDQLLTMQDEIKVSENKLLDPDLNVRLPSYDDPGSTLTNEPPPAYTPRLEDDPNFVYDSAFLEPEFNGFSTPTSSKNSGTPCKTNEWSPPLLGNLPNDFLRINISERHDRSHSSWREETPSTRNSQNIFREPSVAFRGMGSTPVSRRGENCAVDRPAVNGFDSNPDNETTVKSSGNKSKSKKFGQMSRKFKRKKTKSTKNDYQPISTANLIDEDSGDEGNIRR